MSLEVEILKEERDDRICVSLPREAAELAKGCPIFEFDGQVEVRPVMKLNM